MTSDGGSFPEWGPDGRELFYLSGDGMLTVIGLKNGAEGLEPSSPQRLFPVAAGYFFASPCEVSPDGKRILVNQPEQNPEASYRVELASAAPAAAGSISGLPGNRFNNSSWKAQA